MCLTVPCHLMCVCVCCVLCVCFVCALCASYRVHAWSVALIHACSTCCICSLLHMSLQLAAMIFPKLLHRFTSFSTMIGTASHHPQQVAPKADSMALSYDAHRQANTMSDMPEPYVEREKTALHALVQSEMAQQSVKMSQMAAPMVSPCA